MALEPQSPVADDRILPVTRALSWFIIPFLLVAFVDLYFYPSAGDTARSFAWRIVPPFTPMVLASVYLGGSYFFLRAARAKHWHSIEGGFFSVGMFATLMGIATIIHWNKFIHGNVAFWLWAGLYFTTPFLVWGVWLANRRRRSEAAPTDVLISEVAARIIGAIGVVAVASTVFLFLFPKSAIHVWPWKLTELTARVMGAIFSLGVAGVGAFRHRRWTGARILLQVEAFMLVLILVAVVRARGEFFTSRPLTWTFAIGFPALVGQSAVLYARLERHPAV